jgi:hypothetical protein
LRCPCLHELIVSFKSPSFMVFGYLSLSLRTVVVLLSLQGLLSPVITRSLYSLCHCEERSDEAISSISSHILSFYSFTYSRFPLFVIVEFSSLCHCKLLLFFCHYRLTPSCHCELAEGKRGNHILYRPHLPLSLRGAKRRGNHIHFSPHSLSFFSFTSPHILSFYSSNYSHIFVFIFYKKPKTFQTNYQLPTTECHCVYPCLINGTENRPLYPSFTYSRFILFVIASLP